MVVAVPVLPVAELAGRHVVPPSRLTSTRRIGACPLQARPVRVTVLPAGNAAGKGSSQADRTGLTESGGCSGGYCRRS